MAKKLITLLLLSISVIYGTYFMTNHHNINKTLIPKEIIFGNPEKLSVKISPDGKHIAYIAPLNEVLNIYVTPANNINSAKSISNSTINGITNFYWAYDNEHILYEQDSHGDENTHIKLININTTKEQDLTPEENTKSNIVKLSKKNPDVILIQHNERNKSFFDLYSLNIKTSEKKLLFENNEYSSYIIDDDFNIRFLTKSNEDGGMYIYEYKAPNANLFMSIPNSDISTTSIIGFGPENNTIYLLDSRERDKAKLFIYNMITHEKNEISFNKKDEIQGAIINPNSKEIEALITEYFKQNIHPLNNILTNDLKFLEQHSGSVNILSRDNSDNIWTVAYLNDNQSATYYIYNRNSKELTKLFSQKPKLDAYNLVKMTPVEITSRDNLTLVSYLSLPFTQQNNNKPKNPLPMILYVHGGPSVRDSWGLNPTHQWLANRGYAVLSVNYRGSTGFGKKFFEAGFGEWSGKMHDDLIDAVNWAVKEGIADKNKICIMGASYGGYATLVGLTFTPEVFACGIDIVGPSNLVTLLNTIPPYWKPARKFLENLTGGNPDTAEGKKILESKSPLNFVENISKPLLIAQGANDPRVKQSESDQIVNKMLKNNIPVTYILFPDEGHGFKKPHNSIAFFTQAEKFLAKILGGDVEDNKISNKSSMQIIEGAENLK